jgi:hypothetical protein
MKEPEYIERSAHFDPSGVYRYGLVRRWAPGPVALWIMLNPSEANAVKLDPTLQMVLGHTLKLHATLAASERVPRGFTGEPFGGFEVANLYAFVTSKPEIMRAAADPIGPDNDAAIAAAVKRAAIVMVAWGDGADPVRERQVAQMLADMHVQPWMLRPTSSGAPSHPLARGKSRIPIGTIPRPWYAKGLR